MTDSEDIVSDFRKLLSFPGGFSLGLQSKDPTAPAQTRPPMKQEKINQAKDKKRKRKSGGPR